MKTIFKDGVMEATLYPNGWLYLRWMQNQRGHTQKKLLIDLMLMEQFIFKNRLKGWFTQSDMDHREFHVILEKLRAVKSNFQEKRFIQYVKWIEKEGDLYVRKPSKRPAVAAIS